MQSLHHWFRLLLTFIFLIGLTQAHALTEKERDKLRAIPEWLPYVGCQPSKYFRECFKWTADECEGMISDSSNSCLNQHREAYNKPITGSFDFWWDKLNRCVAGDIRAKMGSRLVNSIDCQNRGSFK